MLNIYKLKFQRNQNQCSILDLKSFVSVMETKSRPEIEQLQLVLAYDGRLTTSERTCVGHISCYVNVSDRWVGGGGWRGEWVTQNNRAYTHLWFTLTGGECERRALLTSLYTHYIHSAWEQQCCVGTALSSFIHSAIILYGKLQIKSIILSWAYCLL